MRLMTQLNFINRLLELNICIPAYFMARFCSRDHMAVLATAMECQYCLSTNFLHCTIVQNLLQPRLIFHFAMGDLHWCLGSALLG